MAEDKKHFIDSNSIEIKRTQVEVVKKTEIHEQEDQAVERENLEKPVINQEDFNQTEGEVGTVRVSSVSSIKKDSKEIEKVMADGLDDFYTKMDQKKRLEFKMVGEATALKIAELKKETNIKIVKIINLIKKWLSLIPGVNRFFVEQEAKIRADKIMKNNNQK